VDTLGKLIDYCLRGGARYMTVGLQVILSIIDEPVRSVAFPCAAHHYLLVLSDFEAFDNDFFSFSVVNRAFELNKVESYLSFTH
jgi:hypothetical protein